MNKDLLYPLRCFHGKLHGMSEKIKLRRDYQKIFKEHPKTVFLLLTPSHGNIGDHAIAQAEINLLNKLGINYIEIIGHDLVNMKYSNQLNVFNGFPILINGGGNLGTLWMNVENLQRDIIKKNPKSNIFILPNTIFYEPSKWGQKELQKSIKIYNSHKSLHLFARELSSYNFMKSIYNNVQLIPDMVLSMKSINQHSERIGCLLCLRNDCEKTQTQEQELLIRTQAANLFDKNVTDTDMVENQNISIEERTTFLNKKFSEFSKSELVITDRLHGMIFCAITETPCIVIDSKSPKLRGCYEWIKHLDYIRFANNPLEISEEYKKIPNKPHHYDNTHLQHYYHTLEDEIQTLWR